MFVSGQCNVTGSIIVKIKLSYTRSPPKANWKSSYIFVSIYSENAIAISWSWWHDVHTYVIVSQIGSVLTKASSVVHWHVTNHQFGFASRYIRLAMGKHYDPSSPAASNDSRTASAMILGLWQIWFITISQCTFINDLATNSLRPSCQVTPHHKHKWPQQTLRDTHKHQWTPKQRKTTKHDY